MNHRDHDGWIMPSMICRALTINRVRSFSQALQKSQVISTRTAKEFSWFIQSSNSLWKTSLLPREPSWLKALIDRYQVVGMKSILAYFQHWVITERVHLYSSQLISNPLLMDDHTHGRLGECGRTSVGNQLVKHVVEFRGFGKFIICCLSRCGWTSVVEVSLCSAF